MKNSTQKKIDRFNAEQKAADVALYVLTWVSSDGCVYRSAPMMLRAASADQEALVRDCVAIDTDIRIAAEEDFESAAPPRVALRPATIKAIVDALEAAQDTQARLFRVLDARRATIRHQHGAAHGERKRHLAVELDNLVSGVRSAETAEREARWALVEFRRAAGLDPDRDAAELAKGPA